MSITADQARALQASSHADEVTAQGAMLLEFTYGRIESEAKADQNHVKVPTQPSLALFVMNDLFANGFSVSKSDDSTTLLISWGEGV